MRKFNKDKYLKKMKIRHIWHRYSRYFYITIPCLFYCVLGIYFTYSKFFIKDEQEVIRTTVGDFSQGDVIIGAYLNNEYSNTIPKKNEGYMVTKVVCDNDATGEWDNDNWFLILKNLNKKTKCNIYFIDSFIYDYNYSDNEKIINIKKNGFYKLETWGAQGGIGGSIGGYGAYSTGLIYLKVGDTYYINVGGTTTSVTGGYNGGETGGYKGGGGGSSYIANSSMVNKVMYCYNCTASAEDATKTETTTCNEEEQTENCTKQGNGYAKITLISPIDIEYYVDNIKQDTVPSKNNSVFKEISCEKSSNITWDRDNWRFNVTDYQEDDVCKVSFQSSNSDKHTLNIHQFLNRKIEHLLVQIKMIPLLLMIQPMVMVY